MAISKIIYKANASATPETWMDATPATAVAADITAPKTAMLADGVLTTGTGSGGGGGGLVYEEGTYTPTEDIATPTISFTNTHTVRPMLVLMGDATGTDHTESNSNYALIYGDISAYTGQPVPSSVSSNARY